MINSYRYYYVEGDIYVTSENSNNIFVKKKMKKKIMKKWKEIQTLKTLTAPCG